MAEVMALQPRPSHPLFGVPDIRIHVPGSAWGDSPARRLEDATRPRMRHGVYSDAVISPDMLRLFDGYGVPEWPRTKPLAEFAATVGYLITYTRIPPLDGTLYFGSKFPGEVRCHLALADPWLVLALLGLTDAEIGHHTPWGRRAEGMASASRLLHPSSLWLQSPPQDVPDEVIEAVTGVRDVAAHAASLGVPVGWK